MRAVVRALSWDLGPLRPWEYWQMPKVDWEEAVAIRRAWNEGVEDANDEHRAKGED